MEANPMNRNHMSTTIKRMRMVAMMAIFALALLPTIASAHGGEEHVIGTVSSISPTSVTVKTTAGEDGRGRI